MTFNEGQEVSVYKNGQDQGIKGRVTQVTDKSVYVLPLLPGAMAELSEMFASPIEHTLDGNALGEDNDGWSIKPEETEEAE